MPRSAGAARGIMDSETNFVATWRRDAAKIAPGFVIQPLVLTTPRLLLRPLTVDDAAAFTRMNADPEVMRHFPSPLTAQESSKLLERLMAHHATEGFGWLAVSERTTHEFVGCVGLQRVTFEAAFTPCVDLGWRLDRSHWGKGLATEAAGAVANWAFGPLGLDAVVAFSFVHNIPSRRVMEKLGMTREPNFDFEHPRLPEGHPLCPHVFYRLTKAAFGRRGLE